MLDDRDGIFSETILCSKRDCCPKVTVFEDGSVVIVDTDDGKNDRIELDATQARLLRGVLAEIK